MVVAIGMQTLLPYRTLLHLAIDCIDTSLVKALCERGVKPNIIDLDGNTPLHKAVECRLTEGISKLV